MKKFLTLIITLMLLLSLANVLSAKTITFTKYPDFKLGFTSVIFTKCGLGPTVQNAITFIDLAKAEGFAWVELRDPNGILTENECKAIAAYARSKGIEMGYAVNRGPLDADFWSVEGNAWRNTKHFTGPKTVRVTDGNSEFSKDPNKKEWTEAEFKKALQVNNDFAKGVKAEGLQSVIENANVPIKGNFGLEKLLEAADKSVGYQLDTANFFAVAKIKTDPKDAEAFLRKFASRLYYTHLKSSKNSSQEPVLTENELDLGKVFDILGQYKKNYIAIELGQVESYDEQVANLRKSLDYLKSKGFIVIK